MKKHFSCYCDKETLTHLRGIGSEGPAVHGPFAEYVFNRLERAGATRIVATNSVAH